MAATLRWLRQWPEAQRVHRTEVQPLPVVVRPPPATLFEREITEVGRMAHARRKFVELHVANKSKIARAAIEVIAKLYDIERDASDLSAHERLQQRRTRAARVVRTLQDWLLAQRVRVSDGTATAQAIGDSLNRWRALARHLDDPRLPIENNNDEQ